MDGLIHRQAGLEMGNYSRFDQIGLIGFDYLDQIDREIDRQTDRQVDRQTCRQIDRQIDRLDIRLDQIGLDQIGLDWIRLDSKTAKLPNGYMAKWVASLALLCVRSIGQ